MKKLLVALPLVAGASWAGTTYYAGNQSRTAYDELIAQLQELKPLVVESESYESGFMKSVAYTAFKDSSKPDAPTLLRLRHDIDHSSVAVNKSGARVGSSVVTTTLVIDDLATEVKKAVAAGFPDSTPFVLTTKIGLMGSATNDLKLNPYNHTITHDSGSTAKVTFVGGDYHLSHKGDNVILSGQAGETVVTVKDEYGMPEGEITIGASTTAADMVRFGPGLYDGTSMHEFANVDIQSHGEGINVKMRQVAFDTESDITGDVIDSHVGISIADLDAPIPLNSAALTFSVDGVPTKGMEEYFEKASALSYVEQMTTMDPAFLLEMLDAYKGMFAPGVEMGYEVKTTNDGGKIDGAFKVKFVGDGSATGYDNVVTIGDAIRTLKSSINLYGDADAVNMTPLAGLMMMSPEAEQFIIVDETSYRMDAILEDFNVDVNGSPFPLQLMMGEMADMPISMFTGGM